MVAGAGGAVAMARRWRGDGAAEIIYTDVAGVKHRRATSTYFHGIGGIG